MNPFHLFMIGTLIVSANPADAAIAPLLNYVCDGGALATARYDKATAGAVVVFGGSTLYFQSAMSGSGARYTTASRHHAVTPFE